MTQMKILNLYKQFAEKHNIFFSVHDSIASPDGTSAFCSAGMQKHKAKFDGRQKYDHDVQADIQSVLRCNDIDILSDTTHYAYFHMLGYFDFKNSERYDTYIKCVVFWLDFMKLLDVAITRIVIHPDIFNGDKQLRDTMYKAILCDRFTDISLVWDSELTWSDGNIMGKSTEFYVDDVEVGNIVRMDNGMLDCGFGAERLEALFNPVYVKPTETELLIAACEKIVELEIAPTSRTGNLCGYILWKMLKRLAKFPNIQSPLSEGLTKMLLETRLKIDQSKATYHRLKKKHPDKDRAWFIDTLGVDIDDF